MDALNNDTNPKRREDLEVDLMRETRKRNEDTIRKNRRPRDPACCRGCT